MARTYIVTQSCGHQREASHAVLVDIYKSQPCSACQRAAAGQSVPIASVVQPVSAPAPVRHDPRAIFGQVVASRSPLATGAWCRRCGGPDSTGRGYCGECH